MFTAVCVGLLITNDTLLSACVNASTLKLLGYFELVPDCADKNVNFNNQIGSLDVGIILDSRPITRGVSANIVPC